MKILHLVTFSIFFFLSFTSLSFCLELETSDNLKTELNNDDQLKECSDNYAYLVLDDNEAILSENRAQMVKYPASLTKLMTVYLAFDALKHHKLSPDQKLIASDRAEYVSSLNKVNTLNLKIGDELTVDQAIKGSIIKSFNETTVMLAEAIAGSEWDFSKMMNKKARDLGMYYSNFRNASGLHDDGHYTTSYDLARLVLALKHDFPEYYHYFSMKEMSLNSVKYVNHNHILFNYPGAEGMKTGFTNKAGYNLIAAARKNNHRVISILMSCVSTAKRDDFTAQLLDNGFGNIKENNSKAKIYTDTIDFKNEEIKVSGLNKVFASDY